MNSARAITCGKAFRIFDFVNMGVERVPPYELKRIAAEVTARTGVRVEAYWV